MRNFVLVLSLFSAACGGSLSDEQRNKMREQMEQHEIKKVTDAEITEAALQQGRRLYQTLSSFGSDSARVDSMLTKNRKIRWIVPGDRNALHVEQQLVEAYIASELQDGQDNIQEIRTAEGKT